MSDENLNPLGKGGPNPFTGGQIDTAAISLHELFSAYKRAGFTEDQAFQITLLNLRLAYSLGGQGG